MKTVAIIQARMGSTRLPGKVLKQLCGKSVLDHVVARVRAASGVDEIIVATTDSPADDILAAASSQLGVTVFRGSEADVLSRYRFAAVKAGADVVIRVTSDCPLLDSSVLAGMLDRFTALRRNGEKVDYLSNTIARTFPRGLDAEIFTIDALERAHKEARRNYEREHVTPFIYDNPDIFGLRNFQCDTDYAAYRWTLDTIEDWRLITAIYDALFPMNNCFGMNDVLLLLQRRPELLTLNAHIEQKKRQP